MNRYTRIATVSGILLLLLAAAVAGPFAAAQPPAPADALDAVPEAAVPGAYWTAVGSTGTADEASQSLILHELGYVRLKPNLVTRAIVRYNVVGLDALLPGGASRRVVLLSHFHDNGASAQVSTRLYRVPHTGNPVPGLIVQIDSNPDPAVVGWRSKSAVSACIADFNFASYAYVVEVHLVQTAANGIAALSTLRAYAVAC